MALHKDLTGTNLHEPKGVAAASANRVYVSDGAGSGSWSQVSASVLAQTANPFGAALVHAQKILTAGVESYQSFSAGTWNVRELDTLATNEVSGASLASNRVTLPSGTYFVSAQALGQINLLANIIRLYNVTGSTALVTGQRGYNGNVAAVPSVPVFGRFTLGVSSAIELQHFTDGSVGSGVLADIGAGNFVVADVLFWKIA